MNDTEVVHRGFGHGKVILLGEHAVVYGSPALVGALDIGVEVEARRDDRDDVVLELDDAGVKSIVSGSDSEVGRALQILVEGLPISQLGASLTVRSGIPLRAGLGSSAALAVAIIRALSKLGGLAPTNAEVAALANRSEAVFHGRPSGVDAAAATYGSLLIFRKTDVPRAITPAKPVRLVLAMVEPAPSTHEMVARVKDFLENDPETGRDQLAEIGQLVLRAKAALECGDLSLFGRLIDSNQTCLRAMGVSTPRIDAACRAARKAGALGAKLTGAGGGGVVLALAPEHEAEVCLALEQTGATFVRSVQVE